MDSMQGAQPPNRINQIPGQQQQVMSNGAPVIMRGGAMRDSWHNSNPSPLLNVSPLTYSCTLAS